MIRYLLLFGITLLLSSCAAITVDNGYLVSEGNYRVPVIKNPSWSRIVSNSPFWAAAYERCPEEQKIVLIYTSCVQDDYFNAKPDDLVRKMYGSPFGCLYDNKFVQVDAPPIADGGRRELSFVYETDSFNHLCGLPAAPVRMKVKDVLIEDPRYLKSEKPWFMIFRYLSVPGKYQSGIATFDEMTAGFQWINPEGKPLKK